LHNQVFEVVLESICQLSFSENDQEAMSLVDKYSRSTIVRCIAINKVRLNSGGTPGIDNKVMITSEQKLEMYKSTGEFKFDAVSLVGVKRVGTPKDNGKVHQIGIGTVKDRVLQTQLCLLLDAFYEAKFKENMYGFRKGRSTLQAVGLLHKIISLTDKSRLGVVLLDIKECFNTIPHDIILKYFKVPEK